MKKLISVFCAIVMVVTSFSLVAFSADTKEEANAKIDAAYAQVFEGVMGDADGNGNVTAADARKTLICSAGLDDSGINKNKADVDGDGKITAIDARAILRVAAKLDPIDTLYTAVRLDLFNAIINSVKPNTYKYYGMDISSTDKVTYSDPKNVFQNINNGINTLGKVAGLLGEDFEEVDIGAEFTHTEIVYSYFPSNTTRTISEANFPVYNKDYASLLNVDSIEKIEYKQDQTYTYNHYVTGTVDSNSPRTPDSTVSVSGLDSITVYTKTDNITTVPNDVTTLNNGKIFNVITKNDIDSLLEASALDDLEGMGELGEFSVIPSFNNIKYYNSYVTVYFDHDTGAAVGVDYNLHYDTSIILNMKVKITLGLINYINAEGPVTILSTMTEKNTFYFPDNVPN